MNRTRRQAQRAPPERKHALMEVHRAVKKEYEKSIRRAKRKGWRQLTETLENDAYGLSYKVATGKIKASQVIGNIGGANRRAEDTYKELLGACFPAREVAETSATQGIGDDLLDPPVQEYCEEELSWAMSRITRNRAAGPDYIDPNMVRASGPLLCEPLGGIIKDCLRLGYYPKTWKMASVKMLTKAGDRDAMDLSSYRAICMISPLGKVFEYLLAGTLKQAVEKKQFSGAQHGCTKGRSTTTALLEIFGVARDSPSKYVGLLSVDFKGAFDHLEWNYILKQVECLKPPKDVMAVLRSYLKDRLVQITSPQERVTHWAQRGCAQGSVLGPLLWNVAIEELLCSLQSNGLRTVAYVDDVAILIEARTKTAIEQGAALALETIDRWSQDSGVTISYNKSAFLMLKGKLARGSPPVIRFRGASIKVQRKLTYLGVTIGERMAYAPLVQDRYDKAIQKLNAIKSLGAATWGASFRTRVRLARTVVKPALLYGVEAWGRRIPKYAVNKLEQAHRRILIWCAAAYRTASYQALCVAVGDLPISVEVVLRVQRGQLRIGGEATHELYEQAWLEALCSWQQLWSSAETGRYTFTLLPNVKDRLKLKHISLDHIVSQYVLGHGDFAAKLHFFKRKEYPMCECLEAEEDAVHCIRDCPRHCRARFEAEWDGLDVSRPELFLTTASSFRTFRRLVKCIAKTKGTHGAN